MNAAVLNEMGQTPRYREFDEPEAGEDRVLVEVLAAGLKPLDRQLASGAHYGSQSWKLPAICGTDGVGRLADGGRVLFARAHPPFGAFAGRTVVNPALCFPIPDGVDDCTAAAVFNPGLSAWASLAWRARMEKGESVLILGATGVTGKLAVQEAKMLGAGRVTAAGRNERVLASLPELGADVTIRLAGSRQEMAEAFARAARERPFDVVIDYLWGEPVEALLDSMTRDDLMPAGSRTRLVQAGESAGATIALRGSALRGSRVEILGAGSGSAPPAHMWAPAADNLLTAVAEGRLRIEIVRTPLADVESVWNRATPGARIVLIP
ncbi:MAG: zinc-binding alcohol dehydrogenase family protein [Acidobacteriota bacterium]|nr:zinc-binding alcohol dehydrogenase family protein [Acidobacteriota bacterium]